MKKCELKTIAHMNQSFMDKWINYEDRISTQPHKHSSSDTPDYIMEMIVIFQMMKFNNRNFKSNAHLASRHIVHITNGRKVLFLLVRDGLSHHQLN